MKKILGLIMAFVMCISLFACTSTEKTPDADNKTEAGANALGDAYYFEADSVKLFPGGNMADVQAALGEPSEYFESESCAFQGLDKVYTYNGFIIRTYPENGADYILSIELKDDSVATPEGAFIGDSTDAVKQIYGKPDDETPTALIYKKGTSLLYFIFAEDTVTAITYMSEV